ncbi:MAG: RNA polymerase sigma factor [Solirubrobacterales bacterium]
MYRDVVAEELSRGQFDSARLAFLQVLRRKRMSPQFIERHAEDLFAQACFEFSRQLGEGKQIAKPVAWIVTCGWHRTVGLLETRDWRPQLVSTERVGELGEDEVTPESDFLDEDRYRKVREAVERLPDYQRRLLALSYFEDESVREAGRRLNWTPSKAQRAHEAAQRRLHKLLGVEKSDDLAIEIGLAAFLSLAGENRAPHLRLLSGVEAASDALLHPLRSLEGAGRLIREQFVPRAGSPERPRAVAELGHRALLGANHPGTLLERSGRRASELGRRLFTSGAAEGSAAAAEGGGRAVEVCKAIAAVCLLGGGAVTGALLGGGHHQGQGAPRPQTHRTALARPTPHLPRPASVGALAEDQAPEAEASPSSSSTSTPASTDSQKPARRHRAPEHHRVDTAVKKSKPAPASSEAEFEPTSEAGSPEAEVEPAHEVESGVAEAATSTHTTSSASPTAVPESSAKPKPVQGSSAGEFEP